VVIILRPGKTPDGAEVTLVLRHVIGHIRARWPAVDIVVRGDSHYARPEAMAWCERKRIGYIFSLAGNAVLRRRVGGLAEDAALSLVDGEADKVRRYGELRYAATSWKVERRVIARVEAGPQGADSRFIAGLSHLKIYELSEDLRKEGIVPSGLLELSAQGGF
jgi:hypothetical protein